MSTDPQMPEIDNSLPKNAVRLYGESDVMDDFPILKAFQQYINAEQAKARKRILSLGIFFGILTGAIIAVFVLLLISANARNQTLNDRLLEFAMKDRAQQSAVVVQPPQDNSALLAMTAKLEEVQKKLADAEAKAEREAAVAAERARIAAAEAAKPKGPTAEELEIKRLNALLVAERKKAAEKAALDAKAAKEKEEKDRQREKELEEYRRKHYPELYGLPSKKAADGASSRRRLTLPTSTAPSAAPSNDMPLDDDDAINYFGDDIDDIDDGEIKPPVRKRRVRTAKKAQAPQPKAQTPSPAPQPVAKAAEKPAEPPYIIPVEVKGRSSNFRIPF